MFDVGAEKLLAEALAFPIPERAKLLARSAESFVPEEAESGPTLIARGQIRWFACLADERRPFLGHLARDERPRSVASRWRVPAAGVSMAP